MPLDYSVTATILYATITIVLGIVFIQLLNKSKVKVILNIGQLFEGLYILIGFCFVLTIPIVTWGDPDILDRIMDHQQKPKVECQKVIKEKTAELPMIPKKANP